MSCNVVQESKIWVAPATQHEARRDEMQRQSVVWRINPKQCEYKLMPDESTFCTKKKLQFVCDLKVGDTIYAIGSGTDNYLGLLGKWAVKEVYYGLPRHLMIYWVGNAVQLRAQAQWRVIATLVRPTAPSTITGLQVANILGKKSSVPTPISLTSEMAAAFDLL